MKVGQDIPCSSYSDILDLKLVLDIYNIQYKSVVAIRNSTDLRLQQCQEYWLKSLPCEYGDIPFEIISSLADNTCVPA